MPRNDRAHRDVLGTFVGLLTFLGGVALMVVVFSLAFQMFTMPPAETLGVQKGKAIDVSVAGANLTGVVIKILLLVAMGLMGSLIANRGIGLYAGARHHSVPGPPETPST